MIKDEPKKYNFVCYGQPLNTDLYATVTDEEFENAKKEYFAKPTKEEKLKEVKKFANGGKSIDKITSYYFKEVMAKVKFFDTKWTIEEVFNSRTLIEYSAGVFLQNTKVYPPEWSLCKKLVKRFGIGGAGYAKKPTQFPIGTVEYIIDKYKTNENYLDFSCGWGARMLGAMRKNINYFGIDPNYELTDLLAELKEDYDTVTNTTHNVDIRTQGSEVFIPEWEGKMGMAFSSPPYFDLEDYRIGDQSYKEGTTYQEWLDNYVKPTISNIYKYLTVGGYFVFNIKDVKSFHLMSDWYRTSLNVGFKFVNMDKLEILHRCANNNGDWKKSTANDELIFIFKKE